VSHLATTRTVVAEMWDPGELVTLPHDARADTVAIGRRVWTYDAGREQDSLVREIVDQIGAWLEQYFPT
jgi:hypothetical protein